MRINALACVRLCGERAEGVPGVNTRGRDFPEPPVGVMVHHTAGGPGPRPSLGYIVSRNLANFYISREPRVYAIATGVANHAGYGKLEVVERLRRNQPPRGDAISVYGPEGGRGEAVVNRFYVGIEVENDGVHEPYPPQQIDLLVDLCAGICMTFGWPAERVIHHRESTSRKVDMSWRGDLRGLVASRIMRAIGSPPPVPTPEVSYREVAGMKVSQQLIFVNTDETGNGYTVVPVPSRPLVFQATLQGPYPPHDGYWWGNTTPAVGIQERGNAVVVTVKGGPARRAVGVLVMVAV